MWDRGNYFGVAVRRSTLVIARLRLKCHVNVFQDPREPLSLPKFQGPVADPCPLA